MHQSKEEILSELKLIFESQQKPEKFEALYEKYYSEIFRFVYNRTSNKEVTSDICSEVFLKAMLNIKSYTFKGVPFSAWLFRIAINEVNLYFRKSKNQQITIITLEIIQNLNAEITENENNEDYQYILIALKLLKEKHLKIIELRFFDNKSFKEIGQILGISENNAKVKVYRALDKIKNIIEKNEKQRV